MIEAESGGLLEFVESRFDLSMVAGSDQAKKKLQDAAAAIRAGKTEVLPMGYVICGPVGTGQDISDHLLCRRSGYSRRDAEELPQHVARRYRRQSRARAESPESDEPHRGDRG